jgi:hypothetical protein
MKCVYTPPPDIVPQRPKRCVPKKIRSVELSGPVVFEQLHCN